MTEPARSQPAKAKPAPAKPTPAKPTPAKPAKAKPAGAKPVKAKRPMGKPARPKLSPNTRFGRKGCANKHCHTTVRSHRYVHGPTAIGHCLRCHPPKRRLFTGAHVKGQMTVPVPNAKLCTKCHTAIGNRMRMQYKHKPVANVACGFCHDAHGSSRTALLRPHKRVTGKVYCLLCHKEQRFNAPVKHKPVARRKCTVCHAMHGSSYPRLLTQSETTLCFKCHKPAWAKRKVRHGPVAAGQCGACHAVHGGTRAKLLKKEKKKLCLSCHAAKRVTAQHKLISKFGTEKCMTCHEVHASNKPNLLKALR